MSDKANFYWAMRKSHNPKKVWVIDSDGANITPLVSLKAGGDICYSHNMIVGYLETFRPLSKDEPEPTPNKE